MSTKYLKANKIYQFIIDLLLLNLCLYLSFLFFSTQSSVQSSIIQDFSPFQVYLNLLWIVLSLNGRMYEDFGILDSVNIMRRSARVVIVYAVLGCGIFLIMKGRLVDGRAYAFWVLMSISAFGILVLGGKVLLLGLRKRVRNRSTDKYRKNVVLLGESASNNRLFNFFGPADAGYNVLGIFTRQDEPSLPKKLVRLGGLEDALPYIQKHAVSEVFCSISGPQAKTFIEKLNHVADRNMIRVHFIPDYVGIPPKTSKVELIDNIPVITTRKEPLEITTNAFIKRAFDIGMSLLVMVFIMSWLTPLIALIIKLTMPGPVFFVQLRSGKDNQPFKCYKFRSMKVNAEANTKQATKNDQRITKFGAFLRKSSLDELPQFYNVLNGSMSVVGPRPHMLKHTEQYRQLIDKFMVRQFVKPGITGWAQVNGLRGETKTIDAMEKRVEYDVWYLENWSFFLDLKIIVLTVWKVFRGEPMAF